MDEVAELRAKVASLEEKLAPAHEPFKSEAEVTVCILAYNNWKHLFAVLTAYWRQGVALHMLTAMDRASIDATHGILTDPQTAKYLTSSQTHHIRSYRYLGDIPHKEIEQVCAHAKHKFMDECKTEFIFFNDGDVGIPDGALKRLVDEMRGDDTIGALCIPYDCEQD